MKKSIDGYVRQADNQGAVINTNDDALKAYKLRKQNNRKVDALAEEVKDMKHMLQQILEKLNK